MGRERGGGIWPNRKKIIGIILYIFGGENGGGVNICFSSFVLTKFSFSCKPKHASLYIYDI